MPNSRSSDIRLKVIDRCLRGNNRFTLKTIMEKCNSELAFDGRQPITSKATFLDDFLHIETVYNIEIVKHRVGRQIHYYYADPDFSIFRVPLNDEQAANLMQTLTLLQGFEGMPNTKWLEELIEKFKISINVDTLTEPVVGFDDNLDLKGRDKFAPLLQAITHKQAIVVTYRSFKTKKSFKATVHPYFIKQYNKRWFLFGWNDQRQFLSNFAFDRIVSIEPSEVEYVPNYEIDFFNYFDEMVGVSRQIDSKSEKVRFWVSKANQPYIETKPIHGTQKLTLQDDLGAIFEVDVIINYELKQLLLSHGMNLVVLSPERLRADMVDNLKTTLNNYDLFTPTE